MATESSRQSARRRALGGLGAWVLAAAGLALPASLHAQAALVSRASDPLETILRWTDEYHRLGASLDAAEDLRLAPALRALESRFGVVDGSENEALVALCDLASIAAGKSAPGIAAGRYVADDREAGVRSAAQLVLRTALDAPSGEGRGHWLATQVLARASEQPIPRRIAVAEALAGRHWDSTLLVLFTAAGAPERGLREAAVAALSGWRSDAVDRFLANLTLRALHEPQYLSTGALLDHFASRALPVGNPAALEVASALAKASISPDWREAVRRIPLSRILPNELAVPHLIEALALWSARGQAGLSSRRVEAVLVQELARRSGLSLGMAADRWATWWKVTRENDAEAASRTEAGPAPERRTQAAFFGLHPWTDRVLFVIDRSGSMAGTFGTGSSSRYAEALRQVGVLLRQLGPRTRFNLILFSDDPRVWSGELKAATPAGIERALVWAQNLPPRGGTQLRPAVERALELDPRSGLPDLEKLEADTVIVLCDGATAEGPDWVPPLLRALREPTCIRFDCVQIGRGGNGTLKALASESGGQFVCVEH